MTTISAAEAPVTDASAARPCLRCGCHLRSGNGGDLCDPCRESIARSLPFMPEPQPQQAPEGVDLVKLAAAVMLLHDALHPGEKLDLRRELSRYGVELDHVTAWQVAGKLRRRHGLVLAGESRSSGYRVETWEVRLRRRQRCCPPSCHSHREQVANRDQLTLFGPDFEPAFSLETASSGSL